MLFFPPNKNRDPLSPSFKRKIGTFLIVVMCLVSLAWYGRGSYTEHVLRSFKTPYEKMRALGIKDAATATKYIKMGDLELDVPYVYFSDNIGMGGDRTDLSSFYIKVYAPDFRPKSLAQSTNKEDEIRISYKDKNIARDLSYMLRKHYQGMYGMINYNGNVLGLHAYLGPEGSDREMFLVYRPANDNKNSFVIVCDIPAQNKRFASLCDQTIWASKVFIRVSYRREQLHHWDDITKEAIRLIDHFERKPN